MAWRNINEIIEEQHQQECDKRVAAYFKNCIETATRYNYIYKELEDYETYDDNMNIVANAYKLRDTENLKKFHEKCGKKLNLEEVKKNWENEKEYQKVYRDRERRNIYLIKMIYRAKKQIERYKDNKEKFDKYSKKLEELLELKKDTLTTKQTKQLIKLQTFKNSTTK